MPLPTPNRNLFTRKPTWDDLERVRVKDPKRFEELKARKDCKTCKFSRFLYPCNASPCCYCSSEKKEEYEPMELGDNSFDYFRY